MSAGTVTLGTNTAGGSGAITIGNGSTLAAGVPGLQVANAIQVTDTATIDSGNGVLTMTGQLRGSPGLNTGTVTKAGPGNLALTGFLSVAQLNIAAGRLTLDTAGGATSSALSINLGSATTLATTFGEYVGGAVTTAGNGTIDSGVNGLNLGSVVSGAGSITKIGGGTLTISGGSTYSGATTVTMGTLAVNSIASGAGDVAVQSGATLIGGGSIAGVVTIADGAMIAPGNGIGKLTTGGLVLASGANLAYQLGEANVIGGAFNDLLQVNGNLTLGGGLTVTNSGSFGSGVYRLINYTGALTNDGLQVTSLPGGQSGQIQTAIGGTVNLLVTGSSAPVQYWDGPDAAGNGHIDGGIGSWTAISTNWTSAAPSTINSNWSGGVGVFSATPGIVTVTGAQAFQGLQFASPGYALTGGTLSAAPGSFISTNGGTTTITSTITGAGIGSGALSKQGAGVLVLTGNNSFGGLSVTGGTVMLGSSTAGGSGNIALADGTAVAAGVSGLVLANTVSTAGVGTLDSGAGALTLNGIISGPGSIAKVGSGNLVLNGANGFNGLGINAGTVTLSSNTAGGVGSITLADGTTLAAGVDGLLINNAFTTTGLVTVDTGPTTLTLGSLHLGAGSITGPGSIIKIGSGSLTLLGTNSFNNLTLLNGTVFLGNNSAAGNGLIALADGTTLAPSGFSNVVLANAVTTAGVGTISSGQFALVLNGVVSGPGSISKAGSGNLVLNGSNSFTGLAVNAGTATLGTSTAAGTGTVALAGGTTLAAGANGLTLVDAVSTAGIGTVSTNGFDLTLNGPISGPGSIVETGGGSLTVAGVGGYAGPTTVASGQLRVTGSLTSSTVTVASGASLRGTGSVAGLVVSSGSTVAPGLGTMTGTLSVSGNATFQPGSTLAVNVSVPTNDRLTIGGTASLAGALTITQLAGPLAPATTYTLLSAAGGRSGIFSTVSYNNFAFNAAFAPAVSYTATSVLLGLQPRSLLGQAGGGLTPNERNVAVAYDAATAAGFIPTAFAALFAPGLNLPDALNQLSGEIHSAERRVAMDDTRHVREAALDRLGGGLVGTPGKDDSAATSEHGGHSYTLWARGVGAWGTNRSDGNGSAFNTSTGGAILGIDMDFDGGKIGALFDYTTTTLNHDALGQSKVESTGGGIYAGYRQDHGLAAAAGASVAGIKAHSSRTITVPGLGQTLAGRSDGSSYQAFADVSYDLASGTSRVEPFLRFAWVALDTAAFTETGGSAALTASRGRYTTDVTTAGLRGALDFKGFTIKASAGAQHTGGDRSPAALLALSGDNSPASISAVPVDRWALAADLSGEFRLARNATFAVGYSGVNGDRTRDNGVRGTLTLGF